MLQSDIKLNTNKNTQSSMYKHSKNVRTWSICYIFKMVVASGKKGKYKVQESWKSKISEKTNCSLKICRFAGRPRIVFPSTLTSRWGPVTLSHQWNMNRNEACHMKTKDLKQWEHLPQFLFTFPSAYYAWALWPWKSCAKRGKILKWKESGSLYPLMKCQLPTRNSYMAVLCEWETVESQ